MAQLTFMITLEIFSFQSRSTVSEVLAEKVKKLLLLPLNGMTATAKDSLMKTLMRIQLSFVSLINAEGCNL